VLFSSYEFALLFLPIVLIGFYLIGTRGHTEAAIAWLVGASLFFYGWWNPAFLGLLLASILGNFAFGRWLGPGSGQKPRVRWLLLWLAIGANLVLLGYFKYANFFLDSADRLFGLDWSVQEFVLPLGISFFTFTQIAFLVDAWAGKAREYNLTHYLLFVTYFPHLIAGPVLHHGEMMPQFARREGFRFSPENLAVGLAVFGFGLFKKVVLADQLATYGSPVFAAASRGVGLSFFEAWGGAWAYALQLYFDFSGYSDMAIGISKMFGIRLPINFHSPYRAVNIVDFWRRWHMTLSRFLRDYLYVPLGGNRRGPLHRYLNLMVTMLLGGLWHGAGWTFVAWGALHGLYLAINHLWHALRPRIGLAPGAAGWPGRVFAQALTLIAVTLGWVLFRAQDLPSAGSMLASMAGANGIGLPGGLQGLIEGLAPWAVGPLGLDFGGTFPHDLAQWGSGVPWIVAATAIVLLAPNTVQTMRRFDPALVPSRLELAAGTWGWPVWRPNPWWAALTALLLVWSLTWMTNVSEFLYFQF
jgi:D-alanyl-lipoteichoic acid acyltransferase DltB (MBOAT superfamily)